MYRWKSFKTLQQQRIYLPTSKKCKILLSLTLDKRFHCTYILHVYIYFFFIILCSQPLTLYCVATNIHESCGNELYRAIIFIYSDARFLPTCPSFSHILCTSIIHTRTLCTLHTAVYKCIQYMYKMRTTHRVRKQQ